MTDEMNALQRLGFRPRTLSKFYAKDLSHFYMEQIQKASEKEEPLIRMALISLSEYLEHHRVTSWEACKVPFWERLLAFSYLDLSYEQSLEGTKVFFQTTQSFVEWLLEKGQLEEVAGSVVQLAKSVEPEVLEAVRFLDAFQQKIENPFATGLAEISRETLIQLASSQPLTEGMFRVVAVSEDDMTLNGLLNDSRFTIHMVSQLKDAVKVDMTLIGVLKQEASGEWDILVLDRVFPPIALPFLRQSMGI